MWFTLNFKLSTFDFRLFLRYFRIRNLVCMEKRIKYIALVILAGSFFSCNNMQSKNHGPIVLGDSATIVTENDPEKLHDLVTDLKPEIKTADTKDSAEAAEKAAAQQRAEDSAKKKPEVVAAATPKTPAAPAQLSGNGLKADFGNVTVLIPNVNAKLSGKANLSKTNGAVYSYVSGTLPGNQIQVSSGVTKVAQRYQTVVAVKNQLGTLPLETLSTTTPWQALKGTGNAYKITGLEEKMLEYAEANKNAIHAAVTKSCRRHRMSRRKTQEWEASVHNVRSVNQKPMYVILRSVMWKIDGKDASGKAFSKQIRVDMPL